VRKHQQKQIFELIETLRDAQSAGLYADCQSGAETVGAFIENIEGADSPRIAGTVALLEEYCELLYGASKGEVGVRALRKHLIKLENGIRDELAPDRIEVAFLCYKASMSDSMETIWLAAKADPDCDAYFVAIPYYDRLPDGSLGEMHCEGQDFCAGGIEVADWRAYDIEARHPDAIFIHNPYDGVNTVTSVHPDFYGKRLKSLTDCLVYVDYGIPYWILNNPSAHHTPENSLVLPGIRFCDFYPSYSKELAETMRLLLLLDRESAKTHTKRGAREKVVALGSAKFDKVLRTKREDCELPEAWRRMIGGKKVLLYNTGFLAITQGNEHFLEKIRSVAEAVSRRDDIVLWWRPHPLSGGAYRSMRPHLAAAYKRTVADFLSGGLGIYDDTPDLHRAVAVSDACLTDESSVMFLYLATGKPFSVTSTGKALKNPVHDGGSDFREPLRRRIENMKAAKGANVRNRNLCIQWDNFLEEDLLNNTHYDNFTERFIHYITHADEYPEAEEYRRLQLQMFYDFVENPDGTAGEKIYGCLKRRLSGADA
jgi:hypothetical protein